jgi:hypothetical protein
MTDSKRIDAVETIVLAQKIEDLVTELQGIVGSNGIGGRKIHGICDHSVNQEIARVLCSMIRIKNSAKEHCDSINQPTSTFLKEAGKL